LGLLCSFEIWLCAKSREGLARLCEKWLGFVHVSLCDVPLAVLEQRYGQVEGHREVTEHGNRASKPRFDRMHVVAAMAQLERRLVSERTSAALAVKRSQGVQLGRTREMSSAAVSRIRELDRLGYRIREIARMLNAEGVPTPRNGCWHHGAVRRVLSWGEAA